MLLVDGDRSVRSIVTRFLTKEGVLVITETTGAGALAVARQYGDAIDLLITDVQMPGHDGITLALELRTMVPRLQVLFITGFRSRRLEVLRRAGMACLVAPFTERQLVTTVRALMAT